MKLITRIPLGRSVVLALVSFSVASLEAKEPVNRPTERAVNIPHMQQAPTIEDFLTMEPSPRMAGKMARIEGFQQWIPHEGEPVSQRTVAYLGYDSKNFYAVFVCFDKEPNKCQDKHRLLHFA